MVLLHVVFGRSLLSFPVGVHLRATFGIESCGIRRTWPNHLNLRFCIWGGGKQERINSAVLGSEGLEGFCKGINVPRKMLGIIFAEIYWDFYGVA